MGELLVIGIGSGYPDQVTVQAIKAMNRADTFFIIGKGDEKQALVDLRTGILDEHVHLDYKVVEITDPPRDRTPTDYEGVVEDWHERRAAKFEAEFAAEPGVGRSEEHTSELQSL